MDGGHEFIAEVRARGVEPLFPEEELHSIASQGSGIYIIAASTSQGLARENPDQGVFTAGILKGMKGGADRNADTIITVEELKNFVTDYVTDETNGAQKVNSPLVKAGVDFTLGFVSGS